MNMRTSFALPFSSSVQQLRVGAVLCIGADLRQDGVDWMRFALPRTSAEEQARAARFLHTADALRHLLGRALLRTVLARELGEQTLPASLPTNPWGKPQLPGNGLEFSISHAGDAVWVAITRGIAVGIDVETIAACAQPHELASMLHPDERSAIHSQPPEEARLHFLRCWTRKEAVTKALGKGLSCPLDSFSVATGPKPRDWLHRSPTTPPSEWTCVDLPAEEGYHLSLAAMSPGLSFDILHVDDRTAASLC